MVAGKYHPRHPSDRNPTSRLKRLCCLIDKQRAELLTLEQSVCRANQCTGDDTSLTKELGVYAHFEFGGPFFQAFHLLMVFLIATLAVRPQLTDSLTDSPEQFVVGMTLETSFVGEREHLIIHSRRIAYTQHVDATIDEFLGDPVDRHITLSTYQHLVLATQCLIDSLNEGGCLTCSRRTVNDSHVLRPQHLVYRILLGLIEIRKMHRSKTECLCPHATAIGP